MDTGRGGVASPSSSRAADDGDWGKYGQGDLGDGAAEAYSGGGALLLGKLALIDGLIARPALNGTRGVCTSFNVETGRYNVQLPKGETIALRPSNLTALSDARDRLGGSGAGGGSGGYTPSAEADAAKRSQEETRRKSIGQRLAAQRNAKGIACMKGMSGAFASEEKRQQKAAQRAANPISEDYDPIAEAEAERVASLSAEERELERKANALKELATKHLQSMDAWVSIRYLTDALKLCPEKRELWSNRSHAYEMIHDHEKALADGEKAIEVAPAWPKGYLRTARALMSLERGGEAAARLRQALEISPRDPILLEAYKEAQVLAQCTMRTEKAMRASQLPTFNGIGDTDIVGIERGACKLCDCNAYIQKHGRTTVMLQGRGRVRQDNDPSFFMCARCGHDCVAHKDLRAESVNTSKKPLASREKRNGTELPRAPDWMPTSGMAQDRYTNSYTNAGRGTRGGLGESAYYYAARPAHSPPEPARIDPDNGPQQVARSAVAGATSWTDVTSSRQPPCDDWEAELDPSLLPQVDPLAVAGASSGGGNGTSDAAADPLAAAAASGGGQSQDAAAGELTDAMDPLACKPCA